MLFYLAFKNIISRKSSIVIILFISFSIMLMAVINSLFDCTENGIEKVFSRTFTGDVAIFPQSKKTISLFGDETPVVGNLTKIGTVIPYKEITSFLTENPRIENFVPQVSGICAMEFNGQKLSINLFGIPAEKYLDCMSAINLVEGKPFSDSERGVLISKKYADELGAKLGDDIQFIVVDGSTFRIRGASVAAIYEYPIENETLERIVLADAWTVRSLMDMSDSTSSDLNIDEEKVDLLSDDFDIESMFEEAEDVNAIFSEQVESEITSDNLNSQLNELSFQNSSSWNYIICCVPSTENPKHVIALLNKEFQKKSWPIKAVSWRTAAGSTALYLYWMRFFFNVGLIVILIAGFIIINNTLVVNVLNRTQEIGTLRAEGASRVFISLQCMVETFLLTLTAGVLGCIFGAICNKAISAAHIEFTNAFLRQVFGTDVLYISTSLSVIGKSMLLSVLLGLLGWIYPVRTALKVNPVQAMQGAV